QLLDDGGCRQGERRYARCRSPVGQDGQACAGSHHGRRMQSLLFGTGCRFPSATRGARAGNKLAPVRRRRPAACEAVVAGKPELAVSPEDEAAVVDALADLLLSAVTEGS